MTITVHASRSATLAAKAQAETEAFDLEQVKNAKKAQQDRRDPPKRRMDRSQMASTYAQNFRRD